MGVIILSVARYAMLFITSNPQVWREKLFTDAYVEINGIEAVSLYISNCKRNLCHLQILSDALEVSLSIMELQCPEILITRTF